MDLRSVAIRLPEATNVVVGQSHFIKTVEDIAEIVVTAVPQGKYGLAFNESSGPCLIRAEGNDPELKGVAIETRLAREDEASFVRGRLDAFADVLDSIGVPKDLTRAVAHWPAFAVSMRVEQVFEQTPGPNAGRRLRRILLFFDPGATWCTGDLQRGRHLVHVQVLSSHHFVRELELRLRVWPAQPK